MALSVTNQIASEAFRGQAAIITLNANDAANLSDLVIGQQCTVNSSSKVGYIASIDIFGNTFKVTPYQPDKEFDSTSTPFILAASETINITT